MQKLEAISRLGRCLVGTVGSPLFLFKLVERGRVASLSSRRNPRRPETKQSVLAGSSNNYLYLFFLELSRNSMHESNRDGRLDDRRARTRPAGVSYAWDDRTLDRRLEPTSASRRAEAAAAGPRPPRPTVPAPATLVCSTGRGPVQ